MAKHTTQYLGFKEEVTENTDPIASGQDYYKFGNYVQSWGLYPSNKWDFYPYFTGASLEAQQLYIAQQLPQAVLSYETINTIALYRLLGSSSTAAGVHTITPVAYGTRLPTTTVRYETANASESIRKSMVGCKTTQASFTVDFRQPQARVSTTEVLLGQQIVTPTDTAANEPIYPGSVNNTYKKDSNFVFTWDGVDFAPYIRDFSYVGDNGSQQIVIDGQTYPQDIREGNYQHAVAFTVQRNTNTDIFDDVLAQETELKDVVLTIYQSATEYVTFNFTDLIGNVEMNHAFGANKEKPTYKFEGIGRTLSISSKDGLSESTFYGE